MEDKVYILNRKDVSMVTYEIRAYPFSSADSYIGLGLVSNAYETAQG